MPKVRASSGTIGTMCLPMFLSRTSAVSMRTNAMEVHHDRIIVLGFVERQFLELVVGDRHVEAVAHLANGCEVHLLQLVGRILRLTLLAQTVALDGLGEDHRGLVLVF